MYKVYKRVMDVAIAMIAIPLLIPVFLVIAILIKVDSKGPIILIQNRSGLYGKVFKCYKFRTMKLGTPELPTAEIGEPSNYVTNIGRILRKTSLDELPQLLNIVKGDMSLVGPRPVICNETRLLELRRKKRIDTIKPGLTGYAQINGRDFINDRKKVIYDKYYMNNMCFILDIKILFFTLFKVFSSKDIKA